ncbi:MAG TPA: hypothetical protein VML36_09435 [Nitrospiria bacterium]|nr:hypothetical protein [Nitrospiria bacterium]
MKRQLLSASLVGLGLAAIYVWAAGCAQTIVVEIPPRIDLQPFQTIGIVEFSSTSPNANDALNQLATQKFMSYIQGAQPQVRFLELGPEPQVLHAVGRERLDLDALKAIGKKYGVGSIFTGVYEISDVKPSVSIGGNLTSLNVAAAVNISLVSKHWDTETGATIWTDSRHGQWNVAGFHKEADLPGTISISNPGEDYGRYIEQLDYAVTDSFRPHYERRTVQKQ